MPTQHTKFAAYAEHLLDGYLGLREKWEVLSPAQSATGVRLERAAIPGFRVIRRTLLFATILEAANLCSDKHKTTPSLTNLAGTLADGNFRDQARKLYSAWAQLPPPEGNLAPSLVAAYKRANKERIQERAAEFDTKYGEFSAGWDQLRTSDELTRVCAARDRVVAHAEINYVAGKYAPVDLAVLGVSFDDLSRVVNDMQPLVDLAQHILRSAGFDWSSAEPHFKAARQFWQAQ